MLLLQKPLAALERLPLLTVCPSPTPPPRPPRSGPTIVSVDATYYDAVACVKGPTEGGPWAKFNCTLCQGTKCTAMESCPIGARRRRLAADNTCTSECYLPSLEASTAYK